MAERLCIASGHKKDDDQSILYMLTLEETCLTPMPPVSLHDILSFVARDAAFLVVSSKMMIMCDNYEEVQLDSIILPVF